MKRLSHLTIAVIIAIILSILTSAAITIQHNWDIRNAYILLQATLLSLTLLSLNALIFSRERGYFPSKVRHTLRAFFILLYSIAYIISTFTFISTGQVVRLQTISFIMGTASLWTLYTALSGILLGIFVFAFILHKKFNLKEAADPEMEKIGNVFYIALTLLIITIFLNNNVLNIRSDIIHDKEKILLYNEEKQNLENIELSSKILTKPNVIFILIDSLSAEHLGVYGYQRDVSPNMDSLASKSTVFTNAYTTSTHSDYAQPGVLSSRYMLTDNIRTDFEIKSPRKFIWNTFKEENYTTGYFSAQDDRWEGMVDYLNYSSLDRAIYSITDGSTDYGSGYGKNDFDEKASDKAIEWLNETKNESNPFFLYLNFQAPHQPYAYPKGNSYFQEKTAIDKYDNAIRYTDAQIGKIISYLEKNAIDNNTIIFITSDHGHDLINKHFIEGHGNSLYNDELIVPAIFFIPNNPSRIITERVSHIDFVPTIIDLLNFTIPKEIQGDIMKKEKTIYFATQSNKYLVGMIDEEIKVILDMNRELIEVYNLTADPEESNPLNPKKYENTILKALFWNYCQLDYYKKEIWTTNQVNRCTLNNNFKI